MSDGGIARKRAWFNPSKPPQCTFMLHPSHLGSIGHTIELFERFEIASQLLALDQTHRPVESTFPEDATAMRGGGEGHLETLPI